MGMAAGLDSGLAMMERRRRADAWCGTYGGFLSAHLALSLSGTKWGAVGRFGEYDISVEYDDFRAGRRRGSAAREVAVEDEEMEDFLPSSLRELLTPTIAVDLASTRAVSASSAGSSTRARSPCVMEAVGEAVESTGIRVPYRRRSVISRESGRTSLVALSTLAPPPANLETHVAHAAPADYDAEYLALVLSATTLPSLASAVRSSPRTHCTTRTASWRRTPRLRLCSAARWTPGRGRSARARVSERRSRSAWAGSTRAGPWQGWSSTST